MVFFNYALRKLNAKIVYYGPGLCGKTTNLQWIHDHFEGGQRGKMISLATEGDRTIFFDLLPIDIGTIRRMDVTLQLYTVPGQVHYNSTRQLVLRGADGVVFVADSQRTMRSSNTESFENLQENLMLQGIDLKDFPHVLQFNKRDLRDLLNPEELNESLNVFSVPIFEAVATEGIGVQETLEGIVKLVMRNLREKYEPVAAASGPQAPAPMTAQTPMTVAPPTPEPPKPDPLAPDFVSQVEATPPPQVPSFDAAPTAEPTATGGSDEDRDSSITAFQDEDGIPTRVYDDAEDEIAEFEAATRSELSSADEPPSDEAEPAEPGDEGQGLFVDPRDEDESGGSAGVASEFDPGLPEDEPLAGDFVADVAPGDDAAGGEPEAGGELDLSTEPELDEAELEADGAKESMDDLFDAQPPTVKEYVSEVMNGPGPLAGPGVLEETAAEPAVAPPVAEDRYEDRIEAPGPFAPAGSVDVEESPAAPESEPEPEPEPDGPSIEDQVLQAFGASENREALASLSANEAEPEPETAATGFLAGPPEVEPVVPPVDVPEEAFDDETAETEVEEEPPSAEVPEPEEEPADEPAPAEEEPVVFDQIVVEAPVADEPGDEAEPPAVEEPEPETPEPVAETADEDDINAKSQPIMVGSGDPFADDEPAASPEVLQTAAPMVPADGAIDVSAQDNQLHLQLKGSGAIAEMGQVRALDIEVPVPGQWVGNRKVTLQLRLTLTPAEDGNE